MLQSLLGQIDWPAAFVMIALFVGIGSCFGIYRSTHKTEADIELEKMKLQNEHQETIYKQETWRAAEMKKIEQNLITSHRREE